MLGGVVYSKRWKGAILRYFRKKICFKFHRVLEISQVINLTLW